jgi:hypothetical protein
MVERRVGDINDESPRDSDRVQPQELSPSLWFARFLTLSAGLLSATAVITVLLIAVSFGIASFSASQADATHAAGMSADILLFSLISGVISMAMLQTLKSLLPIRAAYHGLYLRHWLAQRGGDDGSASFRQLLQGLGTRFDESPRLASKFARDSRHQVLDLPAELLAAQISAAVDLALGAPADYQRLLTVLCGPPNGAAVERLAKLGRLEPDDPSSIEVGRRLTTAVDILQISLGHGWRIRVRTAAVVTSGIVGVFLVDVADVRPDHRGVLILASLILGGFFAWLARDLTAIVERARR